MKECSVQGQPSGEAFIQMNFESAAFNAAMHKNNKYLFFNGKKYYIEVLQCSGEDMNQILLGLVPSNLIPHRTHLPPHIHPLSPNPNYYPMQVIYYPSPSIYLPPGSMHHHPTTVLLRGKSFDWFFENSISFSRRSWSLLLKKTIYAICFLFFVCNYLALNTSVFFSFIQLNKSSFFFLHHHRTDNNDSCDQKESSFVSECRQQRVRHKLVFSFSLFVQM